jgi:hypothetical protein
VAAWGLDAETVTHIVSVAKRTPPYGRFRARLGSRCPRDVWVDGSLGFVQFEVDCTGGACLPEWLVFAIELESGVPAAAKSIRSDERGENAVVTDLLAETA